LYIDHPNSLAILISVAVAADAKKKKPKYGLKDIQRTWFFTRFPVLEALLELYHSQYQL